MFFCRHQLLRAPAQRHFSSLFTTRHVPRRVLVPHISTASHRHALLSSSRTTPAIPPESSPDSLASLEDVIKASDEYQTPHLSTNISSTGPETSESTPETRPDVEETTDSSTTGAKDDPPHALRLEWEQLESSAEFKQDPCAEYMRWRDDHPRDAVFHIPHTALNTIAADALARKQRRVMDRLVEDAEYMCKNSGGDRAHSYLAIYLLRHAAPERFLSKRQVLVLLRIMRTQGSLSSISTANLVKISNTVLSYEANEALDGPLFDLLKTTLVKTLPNKPVLPPTTATKNWEATSAGRFTPLAVWPLYRLMLALARRDDKAKASEIMAILLRGSRIDTRAINATDLNAQDYVYVILSVIVRACILNGWFTRATILLTPTVAARERISLPLARLVEDWLVAALSSPRDQDLAEAASMLIILMDRGENYTVPNELLQRFYSEASKAERGELMQAVYRHSREITDHSYRPPRGISLAWFARYLRSERRDVHLSRVLAKHIVEEDIPVEPSARGSLIYNAASFGFTMYARTLWERWSVGPDRSYVVAMSATMLRLVSAFVSGESATRRAAMRRPSRPVAPRINPTNEEAAGFAGDQGEAVQTTEQETRSNDHAEDADPTSDAPHPPSPPPPHGSEKDGENAVRAPSSDRPESPAVTASDGTAGGFYGHSREELLERADDIRRFAERVFDAFCEVRQPLEEADRFVLNAVARGAFLLGRDAQAFSAFQIMRGRGIQLDHHDLNVVIAVVAKANPAAGLARIQKMIDAGIDPDAISYGTVIHWAIFHGDAPLVGRVIEMAREHGLKNFSFKTLSALLHASVQPEFTATTPQTAPLDNVDDIVGTMLELGLLPEPNSGRDCVRAALMAEDPVRAFRFWKELLQDKVEWDDWAWTALRGRIARQIREHFEAGWVDEKRARVMLSELGFDLFSLHIRRRLAAQRSDGSR